MWFYWPFDVGLGLQNEQSVSYLSSHLYRAIQDKAGTQGVNVGSHYSKPDLFSNRRKLFFQITEYLTWKSAFTCYLFLVKEYSIFTHFEMYFFVTCFLVHWLESYTKQTLQVLSTIVKQENAITVNLGVCITISSAKEERKRKKVVGRKLNSNQSHTK